MSSGPQYIYVIIRERNWMDDYYPFTRKKLAQKFIAERNLDIPSEFPVKVKRYMQGHIDGPIEINIKDFMEGYDCEANAAL